MKRVAVPLVISWVLVAFALGPPAAQAKSAASAPAYEVRAFGAKGDGASKDTAAVQKAIDTCAGNGGGIVHFAPGTYLCGTLRLGSNVTLSVDAGATIMGSRDAGDYDPYEKLDFKNDADRETTFFHSALIRGEDVEHVAIIGQGTVDGNRVGRGGPKPIALKRCKFVQIRGIQIVNAPNYCISMLGTDYVEIDGVTIRNAHCDGIDPDSCRNVRISNCHIESVDDAIVPKASFSLGERRSCENITVTNCYLSTECNCFKLGTESGGDFKRIAVSNCVFSSIKGRDPASSGIALETVDGSNLDGVVISNITMVDVQAPIFIRLGNRGRDMPTPAPGTLKNVLITNVAATGASVTSSITGIPGHNVEGVTLSNIRITYKGGGTYLAPDGEVPEQISEYPDPDMFGALPAYGFYCRHVDGLTLSNVNLSYEDSFWRITAKPKERVEWPTDGGAPKPSGPGRPGPAMICDDVANLDLNGFQAKPPTQGDSVLRFTNVRDALLRGCKALQGTKVFLEATGPETRDIYLLGNVLGHAEQTVALGKDVPAEAVRTDSAPQPIAVAK